MTATPTEIERPTVLVVDSCQELVATFEALLADHCDVRTATTANEAFERLDSSVDVVLLDHQLAERGGQDIVGSIHAQGLTHRLAIVSSLDPKYDDGEPLVDEYLVKPVSGQDLVNTVERLARRAPTNSNGQPAPSPRSDSHRPRSALH